jgi:hypothetical protein
MIRILSPEEAAARAGDLAAIPGATAICYKLI